VHDSGAAVIDVDRNFVGLIVGGEPQSCELAPLTFYIPAVPLNDIPIDATLSSLHIGIEL
jgi:hypothetical protein